MTDSGIASDHPGTRELGHRDRSPGGNDLNICFVAHFAYGALAGDPGGHIGGVERQTALMARWLAGRGHTVSVCTWQEGAPDDETVGGVRVLKTCKVDAGPPLLRFLHPRWTSLTAALRRADADLYYHNCAEAITGQTALWAKLHGRRFVYSVASDPETDPALPILGSLRERVLYRRGLRLADGIITQTQGQRDNLRRGFGLEATVLPMPSDACAGTTLACLESARTAPRVVWAGRIAPVKNLELFLDLARQLPEVGFDLVGGADQDADYAARMLGQAQALANVTVHGRLDREAVLQRYRHATLLLCTSHYEGFPIRSPKPGHTACPW
ncbi:MAG: glycosyltransferase family 4 protein [Pseudomonadales bacterium]